MINVLTGGPTHFDAVVEKLKREVVEKVAEILINTERSMTEVEISFSDEMRTNPKHYAKVTLSVSFHERDGHG
jgi:hypothetical protein